MLNDLTNKQRELAEFMSELSEEAYNASWMERLEFVLWNAKNKEISEYGRLKFTKEILEKLELLSKNAEGWIYFDEIKEESFINFKEWNNKFKKQPNKNQ